MIKVVRIGKYRIVKANRDSKFLILDGKTTFKWVVTKRANELFVTSQRLLQSHPLMAMGRYRLYEVKNEPQITDMKHLELLIGKGKWQGYLLPSGFPKSQSKGAQIIPTNERITCSLQDCWAVDYPASSFSRAAIL